VLAVPVVDWVQQELQVLTVQVVLQVATTQLAAEIFHGLLLVVFTARLVNVSSGLLDDGTISGHALAVGTSE
jgi:hypothetical protein